MKSDIAVLGGGMAGLTLALTLAGSGMRVICIDHAEPEATASPSADGRTMAVSWGSQKVIAGAGVWESIERAACPIRDIRISEGGGPVLLRFRSEEVGGQSFGWIAEIGAIRRTLIEAARKTDNLTLLAPRRVTDIVTEEDGVVLRLDRGKAVRASLLVGADGRRSFVRDRMGVPTLERSYCQRAVVCTVIHENPHGNAAIEDFRAEGPFAILPMTDDVQGRHRSSIVWTTHGGRRKGPMDYDDRTFNAALTARFPDLYGEVARVGERFAYPLSLVLARTYISNRMALVADAAHGIHPIAGQGLNIGLRDVVCLAGILTEAHAAGRDVGAQAVLARYERERRFDNTVMAAGTDFLNSLFGNNVLPISVARRAGLRIVSRMAPVKRFLMHQAMGDAPSVRKWIS